MGGVWFWGVRVDVNEDLKFFGKKKFGGGVGGVGLGGQGGCVDVNKAWKFL